MDLPDEEPLAGELKSFIDAARSRGETAVPGEDGVRAMKAAEAVVQEMRSHRWE
jgi:predicted dehydrogenase